MWLNNNLKHKLNEWLKRYLPAEIIGILAALCSASIANVFYGNLLLSAFVGSIGESIGYYLTILVQRILIVIKKNQYHNQKFSLSNLKTILANLIFEFGPSGIIDGVLLRPFFMYLFPIILNNFTLGILVGKIVSDFAFYVLVILSYETQRKINTHRRT